MISEKIKVLQEKIDEKKKRLDEKEKAIKDRKTERSILKKEISVLEKELQNAEGEEIIEIIAARGITTERVKNAIGSGLLDDLIEKTDEREQEKLSPCERSQAIKNEKEKSDDVDNS